MNVQKIISGSVHGNLSAPAVEGSRNVNVSSPVFPSKDGGHRVVVQPVIRHAGSDVGGATSCTTRDGILYRRIVHNGHGRIRGAALEIGRWLTRWHHHLGMLLLLLLLLIGMRAVGTTTGGCTSLLLLLLLRRWSAVTSRRSSRRIGTTVGPRSSFRGAIDGLLISHGA